MGIKGFFKSLLGIGQQMLFPDGITCIACGDEIFEESEHDLCEKCVLHFNIKFCLRCGRGAEALDDLCERCIKFGTYNFDLARSTLCFNDAARKIIHKFKYNNNQYLKTKLAEFLYSTYCDNFLSDAAGDKKNKKEDICLCEKSGGTCLCEKNSLAAEKSLVTFVPLHKKRQRKRGYNQAELLAKEFSASAKLSLIPLLKKTIHTKNLANLTREQRAELIKESFCLMEGGELKKKLREKLLGESGNIQDYLKDKTVFLIDDVVTTTATINECAGVLKKGGAKRVFVLSVASVSIVPIEKLEEDTGEGNYFDYDAVSE